MSQFHISQEHDAATEEKNVVRQGLAAYNLPYLGDDNGQPLNLFLRDENSEIVGGLLGFTYWDFFAIDIFWLDESVRGQGFGGKILALAEAEAVKRGCTTAHLDTFEFQAPIFYEKFGYTPWGSLKGYAGKYSRIYYQKKLT